MALEIAGGNLAMGVDSVNDYPFRVDRIRQRLACS